MLPASCVQNYLAHAWPQTSDSVTAISTSGATPEPTITPQPTVFTDVCGECDVCLKISKDQCKTGGGHNTQPKCEGKGDNYVWCGPA